MDTYEKKYKEILAWAKKYKARLNGVPIEEIIPELRESEDERIRKWLIKTIHLIGVDKDICADQETMDKAIAWLEKQKEFLHIPETCKENADSFTCVPENEETGTRQEQKPAEWSDYKDKVNVPYCSSEPEWSEEDEDMLNSCISSIEESKENRYAYKETDGDTSYDHEIAFLKSLRPSWKPSEEHLSALLAVFNDPNNIGSQTCQLALTDLYEHLKKL